MLPAALGILLSLLHWAAPGYSPGGNQETLDFVPIGVRYDPDPNPAIRRTDLENMRRLRFTVIAPGRPTTEPAETLSRIDRLLARAQDPGLTVQRSEVGTVRIEDLTDADSLREAAWTRLANGARAVIFDDWNALQKNDTALGEAAAFADTLARNTALYVPLRRVDSTGDRAFTVDGGGKVEAHWLESPDALVLIAVNHAAEPRDVTFTFAPAIPEAIWQNMLTGSAVNFVAGPTGPVYTRTFPPHDVLVLMIRKRWK